MAHNLKEASAETVGNFTSIYTRLSYQDYGAPYGRSFRKGILKSIYAKDCGQDRDGQSVNKVHPPLSLLMCFCQLGGGFDTDVVF